MEQSEFDLVLEEEKKKWQALNVSIDSIAPEFGMIGLSARQRMIIGFLLEKEIVTEEELEENWQQYLLDELKTVREALTPKIQEMRRNQITNGFFLPGQG